MICPWSIMKGFEVVECSITLKPLEEWTGQP